MEIYRCKNLREDVLMTGAEETGLICDLPTTSQLGLTFQDWVKVYGNITCWVISSRLAVTAGILKMIVLLSVIGTRWAPFCSSVRPSQVKRTLNIVNFNYHITFCIGHKTSFYPTWAKNALQETLFLTFNSIYEISFIRSGYSHLDFSTKLCQLYNLG